MTAATKAKLETLGLTAILVYELARVLEKENGPFFLETVVEDALKDAKNSTSKSASFPIFLQLYESKVENAWYDLVSAKLIVYHAADKGYRVAECQ